MEGFGIHIDRERHVGHDAFGKDGCGMLWIS